jgi:hypothetical protein
MNYKPNPIDTSDVVLTDEIIKIAELLAKNTHEIWAKNKIEEGYSYGEVTDDYQKTHNSLVPYELLPDSKKEYDFNISLEYIKVLIKIGFQIERRGK